MDPIDIIMRGLALAGQAAATEAGRQFATKLLDGLRRRFAGRRDAEVALDEYQKQPDVWDKPLRHLLMETGAYQDPELIAAATQLMSHIQTTQAAVGRQVVQAGGNAHVVQIDQMIVHTPLPPRLPDISVRMERFEREIAPSQRRSDQPPYGRVQAGAFDEESTEANEALKELVELGFVARQGGRRYELTSKGLEAAKELTEG